MTNLIEVRVPDIGDYKDVEVIEVAVQPGDTVAVDATLVTLETEKATMDVPSSGAGVVREIKVRLGSRVSQGDVIALLEGEGAAPMPSPQSSPAKAAEAARPSPQTAPAVVAEGARPLPQALPMGAADGAGFSAAHASPSIRRFARELGVDLAKVRGTGTKGRITELDVKAHVKRLLTEGVPAALRRAPRACHMPQTATSSDARSRSLFLSLDYHYS